jgi:hypothetical protein
VHVGCNSSCGMVQFTIDGNVWQTWQLDANGNSGIDTFWWPSPFLTPGVHTVTASYLGNSTYAPASDSRTITVNQIGNQPATVTLSANTMTFSRTDLFYAPVHVGCNSACGIVQVTVDGNQWALFLLDQTGGGTVGTDWAGNAYFPLGTHSVKAHFLGNSTYAPTDSNTITVTVTP